MNLQEIPQYPLSLALLDAIPVIFFFVATLIIFRRLKSSLFLMGAVISFVAGTMQVIWKILVAVSEKNVYFLHSQFKYTMTIGFILMIVGIIIKCKSIDWKTFFSKLVHLPSVIFLALIGLCFVAMLILAFTLGMKDVKSQWIEEGVNIIFQGSVLALVLCIGKSPRS